ncbi:sigma-70 family RNA polymerase sigma factor [Thermoanaerobacterium thermosaccharolyticum]|uniref:sigma-70 family RNA polymerase sigma factor n=1 Tax=Thermoanaerobacterium thermosaccharolyticum TaxID=1517 RepID=UPI0002DA79FD|nr:sigma-70 family RNA polymerase sigma factor [Thermoanaerobacterium thermosaccharolyticum]
MINFNDNKITAYIAEGMKNEYIRLSKKNVKIKENEFLILDDKEIIVDNFEYENIENKIFVQEVLNKLTPLKKKIILETIIYGKKEIDIAAKLNISQQAVSKTKKKALEKMRKFLEKKY